MIALIAFLLFEVIGKLPASGDEVKVEWKVLDDCLVRSPNVKWKILKFDVPEPHINVKYGEENISE